MTPVTDKHTREAKHKLLLGQELVVVFADRGVWVVCLLTHRCGRSVSKLLH